MEYRRITFVVVFVASLFATCNIFAQSAVSEKTIPLHIEASLGGGTSCKSMMPIDINVNLNYTFAKRFSLHAIASSSYFLPKNGATSDYNQATNLGGGIGYTFLPQKEDNLGDFELRASVTTSVGSSDFKNTSYNVGIHWYGHTEKHRIVPIVGVGYSFMDYSNTDMSNYNGAYFTLGVRF